VPLRLSVTHCHFSNLMAVTVARYRRSEPVLESVAEYEAILGTGLLAILRTSHAFQAGQSAGFEMRSNSADGFGLRRATSIITVAEIARAPAIPE
jgi:hypothetical protein